MNRLRVTLIPVIFMLTALNHTAAADLQIDVRFSSNEISVISAFYKDNNSSKTRGKKASKGLPPGIAKNLQRGKPLPPGIAKKSLPGDLLVRLPPAPAGYERMVVSGKVLLVEVATQIVHDVLTDIVFD